MENKVLIKLIVPELDANFDLFIPVNEIIWKIKRLAIRAVSDLTSIKFEADVEYSLINKDNCKTYSNNEIVIDTDIRNGTELILISQAE